MKTLVYHPRAGFDYELLEKWEAGLVLTGFEVKALKLGRARLLGARVLVRGGEAYLVGAEISPYQATNLPPAYEKNRAIKLLLTKRELAKLAGVAAGGGLTIIPLSVYNKNGKLKLEIALARGKKKFDKRQKIRERETKRETARTLKSR